MGDTGLEQTAISSKKTHISDSCGAKSGAISADPVLELLLLAWPDLPLEVRRRLVEIAQRATDNLSID